MLVAAFSFSLISLFKVTEIGSTKFVSYRHKHSDMQIINFLPRELIEARLKGP